MQITWLGWAGVDLTADSGERLLVDPLADPGSLYAPLGDMAKDVRLPQLAPVEPGAVGALLTHLHRDHADPAALRDLESGAPILAPREAVSLTPGTQPQYAELADRLRLVDPWEGIQIGPFTVTAVPAVDGLGEAQVSYAITADGTTVLHAGDTTFHGAWWRIADHVGPIDLALLPINGAVVNFPWLQPPSPLPAVLTPEQAVVAARALQASTLGPIHYGGFDLEPFYVSIADAHERLRAAARGADLPVSSPTPGSCF